MSTIFADKFKNTSGGNPVQINQLRGIDTAGSITVQGEGSNTTNLQQGLTKSWCHWTNGNSSAGNGEVLDSFNVGTFTDVGNGASRFAFTSNMGNASYGVPVGGMHDGGSFFGTVYLDHDATPTTSQFDVDILENSATIGTRIDDGLWTVSVLGDLA